MPNLLVSLFSCLNLQVDNPWSLTSSGASQNPAHTLRHFRDRLRIASLPAKELDALNVAEAPLPLHSFFHSLGVWSMDSVQVTHFGSQPLPGLKLHILDVGKSGYRGREGKQKVKSESDHFLVFCLSLIVVC